MLGRMSGIATLTLRLRGGGRRLEGADFRHSQNDSRLATVGKVRCSRRRRIESSAGTRRRHPHQGQPPGRGASSDAARYTPAAAIDRCRQVVASLAPPNAAVEIAIEVEVDTLAQLDEVLPKQPDIVLLDNMTIDELRGRRPPQCRLSTGRIGSVRRRNACECRRDCSGRGGSH